MDHLVIDLPHTTGSYALFYTLAFLTSFLVLILEGQRRKLPLLPWLIVIGTGFVFFVFGCRIATFSIAEWQAIGDYRPLDRETGLTMLGGLLLSVPAIFVARRLLHFDASILDAYAFVLPMGMCIQRIGCFLNGCCFGSTTSGWGVQYGTGTSPFKHHLTDGLVSSTALHSLSVHPVQLYESLGCLLAAFFLFNSRKILRANGSLFYLSGLSYYAVRFVTEFFRDANAHALTVPSRLGLNAIQWLMLFFIAISCVTIFFNERRRQLDKPNKHNAITLRLLFYFLFLSVVFAFATKWLGTAEIFVVSIVLFTTAGYLLVKTFNALTIPRLRLATSCLIIGAFLLTGQTYPEYAASDSTTISYNTISVGGLWGSQLFGYGNEVSCARDNNYTSTDFNTSYQMGGLGFSRTTQVKTNKSFTWGINAFYGRFQEDVTHSTDGSGSIVTTQFSRTISTYGINPFIQWDSKYTGMGIGFHAGDLLLQHRHPDESQQKILSSVSDPKFFPQAYFRIGRTDRVFGEFSLARNFPSSFPDLTFQANIGVSLKFNHLNRGVFRLGTSTATSLFLSSTVPLGNQFVIEPYIGFLSPIMEFNEGEKWVDEATIGAIALHYKFAKKPRRKVNEMD